MRFFIDKEEYDIHSINHVGREDNKLHIINLKKFIVETVEFDSDYDAIKKYEHIKKRLLANGTN